MLHCLRFLSIARDTFQRRLTRRRVRLGRHHNHELRVCGSIVTAALAILFATAATAHQRTFHFQITQQPLSQALRNYGQICGRDVIFTEEVVAGTGAASLEGNYTAEEALSRLLSGTNLVAEHSPSGALMIRRLHPPTAAGEASSGFHRIAYAGADLPLDEAAPSAAQSDAPQSVEPGQERSEAPASPPGAKLEEIVVTGSRIARRDYESDSPVVTLNQSALAAAGQPTLDRAIGEMPQFAAAQGMSEVGDVQGATGFSGGQAYGD
ncbi:MAG: hypothetical protein JWO52_5395, partial [Gammaproteobacteria bacterium]|nr:hypothetical protein [Gammaproteobacteria bacterium]